MYWFYLSPTRTSDVLTPEHMKNVCDWKGLSGCRGIDADSLGFDGAIYIATFALILRFFCNCALISGKKYNCNLFLEECLAQRILPKSNSLLHYKIADQNKQPCWKGVPSGWTSFQNQLTCHFKTPLSSSTMRQIGFLISIWHHTFLPITWCSRWKKNKNRSIYSDQA